MKLSEFLAKLDAEPTRDGWLALCPAHDDSNPSLRVAVSDARKVLVRCRVGCETATVLAALDLSMRDLSTLEVDVEPDALATSRDVPAPPEIIAELAVELDKCTATLLASPWLAMPYAERRFGASEADAERLGLGYSEELDGVPRLIVPFRDKDGVARGFQGRALNGGEPRWSGPRAPEGASWTKVAWFPGTSGFEEVLVCEGPGDSLTSACSLGYDTIGVPGAGNAARVVDQIADLLGDRPAIVAGDGDPAGRKFSSTIAKALADRELDVRVLDLADGMDLTDWREADPARFYALAVKAIAEADRVTSNTAALLAWDEDRYALSDLGGARYLRDYIESLGSGVRFTEEGGFYLLEDGVWRRDAKQTVRTHAQAVADTLRELARAASMEAAADGAGNSAKQRAGRLNSYSRRAQTSNGLDSMLRELQAVDGVPASINDFDTHPDLLAVRNGVVNLRTGQLLPHDPALLLTRRVDVDYVPDAPADRWEKFLTEVFPGAPELPPYMQRLVGYGLSGRTDEQCFVVNWGNGANGKSVFTETLTDVFGEHAVTTPFSTFEEHHGGGGIPNDIAALKGARLVMAAEGEQGRPMAEAMLKRITGNDKVTARFMRREFFTFRPEFLLQLSTNYKPEFKGQDEGLWRRVKLIEWKRYFKEHERDPQLRQKLVTQESEGILAWAVRGARDWYAHGLEDPAVIREATRDYRQTSDALAGFLPGVFVVDKSAAGLISGKELYDSYKIWTDEEGLRPNEIWRRRTFYGALEERGLVRRGSGEGVQFANVRRLKDEPKAEAPAPTETKEAPAPIADPPAGGPSLGAIF